MATKDETSESSATTVPAPVHARQYVPRWRTAEERANGLKAKQLRRRAAHRVALRKSHANG
jgi:hypothetical protein